jgi:Tfp pilus assembly protein PilF
MKTVNRMILCAAAACLVLALGCASHVMDRNREEARQRWSSSRAEMATKLAQGCYQRGEFGRAHEHIDELVRANEPYAPLFVLAARLAAEKGDLDLARSYADNAVGLDPASAEAHYVLGTIEQTLGRLDTARHEYEEAAGLDPASSRYVLAHAELLVTVNDPEQAEQVLRDATEQMPGRSEIHAALGDVLSNLKRHSEAAGSYRVALRLSPGQADVKERLAIALFYSGAYAEAESALADLAPATPETAAGWIGRMRGDSLMALGRVAEARAIFQSAAGAQPASAAPLLGLAKCDLIEKRYKSARQRLELALEKNARDPEGNALMGFVLVAEGRPGEAVSHLELALRDPRLPDRGAVEQLLTQTRTALQRSAAGVTPESSNVSNAS